MLGTLVCLLVASPHPSLSTAPAAPTLLLGQGGAPPEDGARAPVHRWPCAGGSASGSGASATRVPRERVEEAWSVELDGDLVGEPLVWDERVLVEVDRGEGERALCTLDLATGERGARPHVIRSERPLGPSLWGTLIAVRRGDDTLELLRWGDSQITRSWTWRAEGQIGRPLLLGSELYLPTAAGLVRLRVGRKLPIWTAEGHFSGRVALREEELYALQTDGRGGLFLTHVDRRDGSIEAQVGLGRADGERAVLAVHARGVYVFHPDGLQRKGADRLYGLGVPRPMPTTGQFEFLPGTGGFAAPPAEVGGGWIAPLDDARRGGILAHSGDARRREMIVLATPDDHPDFLGDDLRWSVADGVALRGRRAVDLETGRVLWRSGERDAGVAIPARETIVTVDGPRRLVALRARGAQAERPIALSAGAEALDRGRAVFRDGEVDRGDFGVRPDAGLVFETRGRREETRPLAELLLLEDAGGRLVWTAGVEACARGLALVASASEREAYESLADRARGTNDVELMDRLAAEAALRGADDKALARVRRRVEELEGKSPRVSRTRVEQLEADEAALADLAARTFWERYAALPEDAPLRLRTRLLREVLSRGPHAGAAESVRRLLPADLRPPGRFDALDWIDFVEAVDSCPLEIVAMPQRNDADLSHAERMLGRAGATWRADLVGFQSAHLLILSPLARPGAIARCLSMGELVCETLEELLADGAGVRDPERVLLLHLYESQEEYLEQSGEGGGEAGVGLEWTAGHYDPGENLSRIFLPAGDAGFDDVMSTYAHELTHHWLRMQCPRFPDGGLVNPGLPGYWIVEGFASLVEEFRFDPARRSFETFDARAARLDNVANATDEQLWPWTSLFPLSQAGFHGARVTGHTPIASTWYLGRRNRMTVRHAFYSQSAATCQFLFHAEQGARREALFDYLTAYYTGDARAVDVEAAFGMDAAALGAAVRAYARAVAAGERP